MTGGVGSLKQQVRMQFEEGDISICHFSYYCIFGEFHRIVGLFRRMPGGRFNWGTQKVELVVGYTVSFGNRNTTPTTNNIDSFQRKKTKAIELCIARNKFSNEYLHLTKTA